MKRFLFLGLIYTLNILMFLFAKSAGASVVYDRIAEMKMVKTNIAFTLEGHQETLHVHGRGPAVECLKKAATSQEMAGIELDNMGTVKSCKLVVKR